MACADCATCLAVLPDDNASPSFVKVADVAGHRLLFFSDNDDCTSATAAPAEWQTRAAMDGGSDEIAESYFPPDEDYIALFVIALALLPAAVLAHGHQEFGKNTASTTTRLLILGGGGGVLESLYSRLLPSAIVDVVEPSQAVRMLGHRYFGAKAEFHHMQARRFVHPPCHLCSALGLGYECAAVWFGGGSSEPPHGLYGPKTPIAIPTSPQIGN